jgi:hypothetical protein
MCPRAFRVIVNVSPLGLVTVTLYVVAVPWAALRYGRRLGVSGVFGSSMAIALGEMRL